MGSTGAPLWLSIASTLVVIFNGVAVFKHRYTNWSLLAVAALALMFFTGMYLFVLPYVPNCGAGDAPIELTPGEPVGSL